MTTYIGNPKVRRVVTFGLGAAGIVWAVFELARLHGDAANTRYPYWALLLASIAYLVIFAVLEHLGTSGPPNRSTYGWVALMIGADGRLSTSKTQAVLWTAILATVLVFLAGIVGFGPGHGPDLFDSVHWEQYLVLLGGPFAVAVLAKFTTVAKLQSGSVTKSLTGSASSRALGSSAGDEAGPAAKVADAFSNDAGEVDIPDTQYLIFNFVAIAYFLVVYLGQIFQSHSGLARFVLPDIPSVILGLTSVSAATYVGYKATQRDAPRIVSVTPDPTTAGQLVTVVGVNLVPTGESAPAAHTAIWLQSLTDGDSANTAVVGPTDNPPIDASRLGFRMPPQFAGKRVAVRIVTAGSVATDTYAVTVEPST
jgi:hypothetical protein